MTNNHIKFIKLLTYSENIEDSLLLSLVDFLFENFTESEIKEGFNYSQNYYMSDVIDIVNNIIASKINLERSTLDWWCDIHYNCKSKEFKPDYIYGVYSEEFKNYIDTYLADLNNKLKIKLNNGNIAN